MKPCHTKRLGWAALGLAAAVGSVSIAATENGGSPAASIGHAAPDFELKDSFGKPFKLSEFKGKIVVLEWLNQGCPVSKRCHTQHRMQDTYRELAEKVVWLGIDTTAGVKAEKNRVYAAKVGLPYPILHDTDGKVAKAFGAKRTPHMFVIDAEGKLIYSGAIDDDAQGKKEKPQNYVMDAVTSSLEGKTVAKPKTDAYGCGIKYP